MSQSSSTSDQHDGEVLLALVEVLADTPGNLAGLALDDLDFVGLVCVLVEDSGTAGAVLPGEMAEVLVGLGAEPLKVHGVRGGDDGGTRRDDLAGANHTLGLAVFYLLVYGIGNDVVGDGRRAEGRELLCRVPYDEGTLGRPHPFLWGVVHQPGRLT